MLFHENLNILEKLLKKFDIETFHDFLNLMCHELHFDGALIYTNIITPEKVKFLAGVHKGSPIKPESVEIGYLSQEFLNFLPLFSTPCEIYDVEITTLPPEVVEIVKIYGLNKLFLAVLGVNHAFLGILLVYGESPRELSKEERERIKAYAEELTVLLRFYRTDKIYRIVRDNIREHIVIQDPEHRIIEANRAAGLSVGIENPEELVGKFCYKVWHGRENPCEKCPLELSRQTLKSEEMDVKTPDGRYFHIKSNPIFGESGELIGFIELTEEITEKVKAQEQAEYFNKFFKATYEQPFVGVVISKEDGKVVEANPARAEMLGYTVEEFKNLNWKDYTHPEDTKKLEDKLQSMWEGEIDHFEETVKCTTKDGQTVYQRIYVIPFSKEEKRTLTIVTDVTKDRLYQQKLENITFGIIKAFSKIVEFKEPYTAGHQKRVAEIAKAVGVEMGLEEHHLRILEYAGLLHDIGKLVVPIEILNKPGRLDNYEFGLVKMHPEYGYRILQEVEFDGPVAEIVYMHHERMDGSGYPRGLKDGEILLEARILACADVFEAMTSHRPYRPALPPAVAMEELQAKSGILYDPDVVKVMAKLFEKGVLLDIIKTVS